jgi:[ribosomal protein S5]-alanine N-acetyltransferase
MANRNPGPELAGDRVVLRRPRLVDASDLERRISDAAVVRWTIRIPHPYPKGGARRFIRSAWNSWTRGRAYTFAILVDGEPCGIISLRNVSMEHACGELGFWLGRDQWGRGIMTEAVRLMLRFAFEDLGLYRVYASTFAANDASRRVLEKNGLSLEGTLREAIVRYGARQDFLQFGILRPEYEAACRKERAE